MLWKTQQDKFKSLVKEEMDLLNKKGGEYAADDDALANFKMTSKDTGVSPLGVLMVLMTKHYRAIQSYVRNNGQIKSNEPIEGRIADMRNYLFLMSCLIDDLKLNEKSKPAAPAVTEEK
jgi:hypothetical protein